MKFGRNQPKPRGFNYRPFYRDEREEEREKMFGHLHQKDSSERQLTKGSLTRKRKDTKYADKILRIIVALVALGLIFYKVYVSDFDYSSGIERWFK